MSKLTFSTIPDVCLLLVFDKIPLNDLLRHVNLVNRHWNTISGVACQNRKRLVLSLLHKSDQTKAFDLIIESIYTDPFEVSRCQSRYFGGEDEALIVPEARKRLNGKFIERLIERLPNIKPWTSDIIPLVRIKSVHLDLNNIRWHQYLADHLCLNLTFPNLELISIQTSDYACVHCGGHFNSDKRETSRKFEWHKCLGQFLEPIAKCDKLKRIEYWDDYDLTIDCSLQDFKLAWAEFFD